MRVLTGIVLARRVRWSSTRRRRQRSDPDDRSLRPRAVHRCRRSRDSRHSSTCASASMAGMLARGCDAGRSRRPVRARRRHASRSRLRRAVSGLQLDGVSRAGRLRRVLRRHDRLRPIDAAGRDERSLQSRAQSAGSARAASHRRAVHADVPQALTTIASDWDDVGAAVDYIRALRGVERVSLVAWSLGGPRAGGYAAQNPQKVHRLVLLAPGYNRRAAAEAPRRFPPTASSFNTQSRAEFDANWDRQVGCPGAVRAGGERQRVVGDARSRIRSAPPGVRASVARRRRRRGAGMPPSSPRRRRRR